MIIIFHIYHTRVIMKEYNELKIAVAGTGYVGLSIAIHIQQKIKWIIRYRYMLRQKNPMSLWHMLIRNCITSHLLV